MFTRLRIDSVVTPHATLRAAGPGRTARENLPNDSTIPTFELNNICEIVARETNHGTGRGEMNLVFGDGVECIRVARKAA